MPVSDPYEQRYRRQLAAAARKLRQMYADSIIELSLKASKITLDGEVFDLRKHPALKRQIDDVIKRMHGGIYTLVENGISGSWDLSNEKNDRLVDRRLAGRKVGDRVRRILYDPNKGALDSFIKRKEKGISLSDRVWRALETHRNDLERGLGIGISNGESAAEMAREQQKYLDDPDRLYRRVRDNYGKLKLSKPAQAYSPGPGVYRSSYQNALRLARTETNIAYRRSDFERWRSLPFVVGVEIKLSDSHPKYDICDVLAGRYPKWFDWSGWHPNCICFAIPIMMTDEEFDKLTDAQLGLGEFDGQSVNEVKEMPAAFNKYVQDHQEQMARWKNKPYWMQDNPELIKEALASKIPRRKPDGNSVLQPAGIPIGPQFTNIQRGITPKVKESLSLIDRVHGDGTLDNIPFTETRTSKYKGAFYSNINGSPVRIDLARATRTYQSTLVHEMGHFLDLQGIGVPGKFASTQIESPLAPVIAVAKKSKAIRDLQKLADNRTVVIDDKEYPLSPNAIKFVDYLLNPKEIWARAYTQYIANKTKDKAMNEFVQEVVVNARSKGYQSQWEAEDFKKIEEQIEQMMLELGWINQS